MVARMTDARERLVRTAQQLFAARGVAATSPRDVLATSGVGQGSLYHHFPTKHDLTLAAVGTTVDETLTDAMRVLADDVPAVERVVRYLSKPRDALAGCKVGRLTGDQAVMDDDDVRAVVGTYFTRLLAAVRDVLVEAGLPDDVARDRAHAAVAVVQGGYVLARATGDPEAMRAALRGFAGLLGTERTTPTETRSPA